MRPTTRLTIQLLCAQRDYQEQQREYEKARYEYDCALEQLLQAGTNLAKLEERVKILQGIQARSKG